MKRLQKSHWIAGLLVVVAGTAIADVRRAVQTPTAPSAQERATVSPACKQFFDVPAGSTSDLLRWDQRLSLAGCRPLVAPAAVSDPAKFPALITALETSAAPSLAAYRDAIDRGPAEIKIAAAYDLGMAYVNLMVRARNAVRVADTGGMYGGTTYGNRGQTYLDRLHALHATLEQLLSGERAAALAAFDDVARLADENPAAATANDFMRVAVSGAREQAAALRQE